MTMQELAAQYRQEADTLEQRIKELQKEIKKGGKRPMEVRRLRSRANQLTIMMDNLRDEASVMEHYYDDHYKQKRDLIRPFM